MESKCNKQVWLENALKKLYKKVDSLEATEKPRNHQKRKLNVPSLKIGDKKRKQEKEKKEEGKEDIETGTITSSEKQRQQTECNDEKFWNFVDEFIQSKPLHARCKNGFFNSVKVPPTVNYAHWKSEGNTIAFPSRIICLTSDKLTVLEDPKEGFLKTEIEEETTLEERIFLKIQKIRMKKATDAGESEKVGKTLRGDLFRFIPDRFIPFTTPPSGSPFEFSPYIL